MAERAFEDGSPDSFGSGEQNGQPQLDEAERERLTAELKKTEDEISTLRQVLAARTKHSAELKRKLGISTWRELQDDVSTQFKHVKETPAYQKTEEFVHVAGEKTSAAVSTVGKKLGELRNTPYFKSVEEKVGTAYTTVKAKISASASMDGFYGKSQPTTPSGSEPTIPENMQ